MTTPNDQIFTAGAHVKTPMGLGVIDRRVYSRSSCKVWLVKLDQGMSIFRSFREDTMTVVLINETNDKKVKVKPTKAKIIETPKPAKKVAPKKVTPKKVVAQKPSNPRPVKPAGKPIPGFKEPKRGDVFKSKKSGKLFHYLQIGSNGKVRLQPEGHLDYYDVTQEKLYDLYEKVK